METLSRADQPMSNGQIARETGLPPSTISRLTDSLVQLGYLKVEQGVYTLTPKNLRLGYPVLAGAAITSRAQRALDNMAALTGCSAGLAVRDELHVTFLATTRGPDPRSVNVAVGGRLPISPSAAGLVLLEAMNEPYRSRLVRSIRADLQSRKLGVEEFDETLTDAKKSWYVMTSGTWRNDITGIATAVRSGGEIYALTIIARGDQAAELHSEKLIATLRDGASRLSD